MPYFRNNHFSLFNRERRKSSIYFHTNTGSRWFSSLASKWKSSLLQLAAFKMTSLLKRKDKKHSDPYIRVTCPQIKQE